jgi:acyl-CoA reductase-like NAD-dependent aldehyde dehydrogenase
MNTFPVYCAGSFITTQEFLDVVNPHSQKVIAKAGLANEQLLEEAILKALDVSKQMAEMPSYMRYEALQLIAKRIKENHEELALLLAEEAGKPMRYARGEIDRAVQTFIVASEEAKRHPAEILSLDWTAKGHGKQGYVKYFPVGLVAGISPFNFPMNLAVHKLAPAIATGCPIILKPSSSTPLSTLALAKIIDETQLPKGAVSIMPMDRKTGNRLVTDDRIKLLSFTGSPSVGWRMKADAGRKKVLLELGGNAGVIITKTADLDKAVKQCVVGAFAYSGQVCIHSQRIFVEKEIFDAFTTRFVQEAKKLRQGAPEEEETEITSMIDLANAERVESWVNEALEDGSKLLCGGKREGTYYEPTVLTNTHPEMKVCALEVFGPVVTVDPVESFEEAVELINDSQYGLQAAVYTQSIEQMDYAHKQLEVGGVIINDITTFRVDHMPYGGVKNSGLGREGIKYSMHEMLEPRLLVR